MLCAAPRLVGGHRQRAEQPVEHRVRVQQLDVRARVRPGEHRGAGVQPSGEVGDVVLEPGRVHGRCGMLDRAAPDRPVARLGVRIGCQHERVDPERDPEPLRRVESADGRLTGGEEAAQGGQVERGELGEGGHEVDDVPPGTRRSSAGQGGRGGWISPAASRSAPRVETSTRGGLINLYVIME
ncbi:hypothetical protein [Cellulomonas cellasea]|uniref:hypothetical protein n=1 Tax=Cellulomonas cellasea TaxID=43670 RepID=UPI00161DAC11|nr:hypothetical protein [Cellulomonas cellasea]